MDKRRVVNVLAREWRHHLSCDEFSFLHYLIDNTIEWGRDKLDATLDQMINGVPNQNGSGWSWKLPPIGIARRTLERLITRLKDRGAILVEAVRNRCTIFRLNLDWTPTEGIMGLKIPKRLQNGGTGITAKLADMDENDEMNNRQFGGPYKQNDLILTNSPSPAAPERARLPIPVGKKEGLPPVKERTQCLSPAADPAAEVRARVEQVKQTSVAFRQQKAEKARATDSADAYHQTYTSAWFETYTSVACPTLTAKERHAMRAVLRSRFDDVNARHDFLSFTVRNWAQIMATKFGWMRQSAPPPMPKIGFMLNAKMIGHFLDAYADRRRFDQIKLLPAEQQEVERLVASGVARDEALTQVGERRALSKVRAEDRAVRAVNRDMVKQANETYARTVEERKQLLRDRAEAAKETRTTEGFDDEIGAFKIDDIELPAFDPTKWN